MRLSLGMLALAACASVLLASTLLAADTALILTDAGAIVISAFAAGQCFVASRQASGRNAMGWRLVCAGATCWAVGELLWGYYDLLQDADAPFPSLADVAYLAAYPLILAGLLLLAMPPRSVARVRTLLDALLVVALAAGPIWHYVAEPTATAGGASALETAIGLGYPMGDLLLLFGIAVAALRTWRTDANAGFGFLTLGLALFTASDFAFALLEQDGSYTAGSLVDGGWLLGYGLIALASALHAGKGATDADDDTARTAPAWRQVVPMLLLVPAVVWFIYLVRTGDASTVVEALVVIAVLLVVCRSALAVIDILALNRDLVDSHKLALKANEELRRKSRQLNNLLLEAVDISRKDSLTGLFSRAAIVDELERAMREQGGRVHVAMLDVDELKRVNDSGGHAAGDALLRDLSSRLLTLQRSVVGRYAGDEFLAFSAGPDISVEDFEDSLRRALDGMMAELPDGPRAASASWGVATYPGDGMDAASVIKIADFWLYKAKARRKRPAHRLAA